MGVYLSSPITEKISTDEKCIKFTYGASSMQGWRMSQEDAHNCVPEFEEDTSLFAVYDGHGGAEVAQYCALHLPEYIKHTTAYKDGRLDDGLQDAFLGFDATLTQTQAIRELKTLAGVEEEAEEKEGSSSGVIPASQNERDLLLAEANMPLEEVLAQYDGIPGPPLKSLAVNNAKHQFQSPMIRPKAVGRLDKAGGDTWSTATVTSEADSTKSSHEEDTKSARVSLDNKLANGHADNDNNLNIEKEISQSFPSVSIVVQDEDGNDVTDCQSNSAQAESIADCSALPTSTTSPVDMDTTTITKTSCDAPPASNLPSSTTSSDGASSSMDTGLSTSEADKSKQTDIISSNVMDESDTSNTDSSRNPASSAVNEVNSSSSAKMELASSIEPNISSGSGTQPDQSSVSCPQSGQSSGSRTQPGSSAGSSTQPEPSSGSSTQPEPSSGSITQPKPSSGSSTQPEPSSGSSARPELSSESSTRSEPSSGSGTIPEPSACSSKQPGSSSGSSTQPGSSSGSSTQLEPSSGSSTQPEPSSGSSTQPEPSSGSSTQPEQSSGSSTQPEPSSASSTQPGSSSGSNRNPQEGGSSSEAPVAGSSSGLSMLVLEDDSDDDSEDYEGSSSEDVSEEEEESDEGELEEIEGALTKDPMLVKQEEEPGSDSGCTAVVAIIKGRQLVVANSGDSRCVLCRDGKAVDLSFDHKPEDFPEQQRIEMAGGKVTMDGRVNGGLNLSRAIGDHCYKKNEELPAKDQMITAFPDIQSTTLGREDEFLVLACDGIWNYMNSQEVVDFVRKKLSNTEYRETPSRICEEMFDHCLAPNTMGDGTGCDNMTCIVILLEEKFRSSGPFVAELEPVKSGPLKRDVSQVDRTDQDSGQVEKKRKLSTEDEEEKMEVSNSTELNHNLSEEKTELIEPNEGDVKGEGNQTESCVSKDGDSKSDHT